MKDLPKDSADLHKLKMQAFIEMPPWAIKVFEKIKRSLLNSEALDTPKFTTLHKNPFIVGLDFSIKAIGVTLSQVQKGKDGSEHRRLHYCFGQKNTTAGQNYSSHKGKTGAFVWALKNLDLLLKIAPFIVETDSMSVKYIRTLKTMKGVYVGWSEIIEEFTFVVIHVRVTIEDCISREPRHLPEPTRKDYLLERDYESDPEPGQDLEKLAKAEASLEQREETLWQVEEDLRRSSRVAKPTTRIEQY